MTRAMTRDVHPDAHREVDADGKVDELSPQPTRDTVGCRSDGGHAQVDASAST
jgi:hypothetical protein